MDTLDKKQEIIFLNTPISDNMQDVIGVDTYVRRLNYAIDSGAQMIAITAPFGSGKTSVIELLEKERASELLNARNVSKNKVVSNESKDENRKQNRQCRKRIREWKKQRKNEKIIKISMWSQLYGEDSEDKINDLHRSFIFQFASQINHKRGTYIRRRLNPNYGLMKLHVNKMRYWICFMAAAMTWICCWFLSAFGEEIVDIFPVLDGQESSLKMIFFIFGIVLLLFVLSKAEIIFSSIKSSAGKRNVEATEIIDLYREEILKYAKCRKKIHSGRFIVVIEDLDRTSDAKAVIHFLKELRKYYIPHKEEEKTAYQNQVIFIVNVKPESLLSDEGEENVEPVESLYAKLFDYVLNLQTINIDNYDSILEGLLEEKRELIEKLGLKRKDKLSSIAGMRWIIRERRLGIREIKERLNIAFSLYESLVDKFPEKPIAFERCAVVAYLTTAYEKEFYKTEDRAFQKLVDLSMKEKLTDEICAPHLPEASQEYVSVVRELIDARLIDGNYRTYFYNYPKGSYLYSLEEMQIFNAILYADKIDRLEEVAKKVEQSNPKVFQRAFQMIEQLGLPLKYTTFEAETLYIYALKYVREKVFQYVENLDYAENAVAKNIKFFAKIISYDKSRQRYSYRDAARLCNIWEQKFSETALLQLRMMLCKEFPSEIVWYEDLFSDVHNLICNEEMDYLSLQDSISLINFEHEDIDIRLPVYLQQRFSMLNNRNEHEECMEKALKEFGQIFSIQEMSELYLDYMNTVERIIPEFEEQIANVLKDESTKEKEKILDKYQQVVNKTAKSLSAETLDIISSLEPREGYSLEVAKRFWEEEYYLDYVLILLFLGETIPFEKTEIRDGLESDAKWLMANPIYLMGIRKKLSVLSKDVLLQYKFLFTEKCPSLSVAELAAIQEKNSSSDEIVMHLLPHQLVSSENYKQYAEFFCRKRQTNAISYEILMYISKLEQGIAKMMFYSLDFDMIRYRYISSEKKAEVKKAFETILELDIPEEQIKFMSATKCIDATWESELIETMKEDDEIKRGYCDIVNRLETVSKATVNTLCKIGPRYPMSDVVNQGFYDNKKYVEYIVSETIGKKNFEVAAGDKREELWPSYLKIFSGEGYSNTRGYMSKNRDFVSTIMHDKSYTTFDEENRMQMTGVFQDSESIKDVMEYGEEFALEYYSKMAGFEDEEAASCFVTIVEKNDELLASDKLYAHTHEKLINGRLKAKYTNARKKKGYMN